MAFNTKKISDQERAQIHEWFEGGKSVSAIKEDLNRSPNSEAVDRVIQQYKRDKVKEKSAQANSEFVPVEGDVIEQVKAEEQKNVDQEGWREAAEDALEHLESLGVARDTASSLIRKAMDEVDLTQEPQSDSLISFSMRKIDPLLHTKTHGSSSVVSMTGAASKVLDSGRSTNPQKAKYDQEIFRPKG